MKKNWYIGIDVSKKWLDVAIFVENSDLKGYIHTQVNNDYYRAGTTTMSDLLDAQSSYQQSRDKYVDAYIDYQQNLLKYRQATGQCRGAGQD